MAKRELHAIAANEGGRARLELEFDQPYLLGPLFGDYDRHLITIEQRLGVHISARGNRVQIEGEAEEIGHPLKNSDFCKVFEECFKGSFDAYTSLENERLFAIKPAYIQRWKYKSGSPYIEGFDFKRLNRMFFPGGDEHNKRLMGKLINVLRQQHAVQRRNIDVEKNGVNPVVL